MSSPFLSPVTIHDTTLRGGLDDFVLNSSRESCGQLRPYLSELRRFIACGLALCGVPVIEIGSAIDPRDIDAMKALASTIDYTRSAARICVLARCNLQDVDNAAQILNRVDTDMRVLHLHFRTIAEQMHAREQVEMQGAIAHSLEPTIRELKDSVMQAISSARDHFSTIILSAAGWHHDPTMFSGDGADLLHMLPDALETAGSAKLHVCLTSPSGGTSEIAQSRVEGLLAKFQQACTGNVPPLSVLFRGQGACRNSQIAFAHGAVGAHTALSLTDRSDRCPTDVLASSCSGAFHTGIDVQRITALGDAVRDCIARPECIAEIANAWEGRSLD